MPLVPGDPAALDSDLSRLAQLEADLRRRFDVVETSVEIGARTFALLRPRSVDDLLSEEDFARDERIPYWADIWPSSRALAEHLIRESGAGRRLLELGCGVGLVSAAAASVGFEVVASDYYSAALEFTQANSLRNGLPPPQTRNVDWRRFPEELSNFDVVVGSDVLYEPAYSALVPEALAKSLAPGGTAWMTDPMRRSAAPFADECRARGLKATLVRRSPTREGVLEQDVGLYKIVHAR